MMLNKQVIANQRVRVFKSVLMILSLLGIFAASTAMAAVAGGGEQAPKDLGSIATNITQSFSAVGSLMIGIAYVAGIGFTVAAIFKFKQHKDNPTQIPLGTPIAMFAIGVALLFLPSFIKPAGYSLAGSGAKAGAFTGGSIDATGS